jgi:hypothetical protein
MTMKALIATALISAGIAGLATLWAAETKAYTEGHTAAIQAITKACADKGYFKAGILTYQCQQLFVIDDTEPSQ